jgi:hypothetical protein
VPPVLLSVRPSRRPSLCLCLTGQHGQASPAELRLPARGGRRPARREADEVALEWVREYTFSVNNPHDPAARNTFWFLFGDGRVTYNDLNTRLEVKKRARRSESDFQRPAQARPRPGQQPT